MTYCRRHLRERAIAESEAGWVESWGEAQPHDQDVYVADPLDLLPGTYEELVAWGLGLEVDDLPGWGTAVETAGLRVFSPR